jgi:hypothetical protein
VPDVNIDLPCASYTGAEPFAFISYAHLDAEAVYPEIQRLDLMGYRIWYDEGIDPGNEWPEEVANALKTCAQFIVFITQRAIGSRNVRNEINYALKLSKPFFAIHLVETELPPGMDLQMSSIQAIFKWRMNEQTYIRNIEKALPPTFGSVAKRNLAGEDANDEGLVELLARTAHSEYQSHMKGADRVNWHQLDPALKTQCLIQSRFLLSMLHMTGFNVCSAQDSDSPPRFTDEDIDLLGRMEHDRWSREKIEAGWRYGERKDIDRRLTPYLIPWSEMPEQIRKFDRVLVRNVAELLLKSGYAIKSLYRQPGSKTLFHFAKNRIDLDRE